MNCHYCQKPTQPKRIGTSDYCSSCGRRYHESQPHQSKNLDITRSTRPAAALHQQRAHSVIDLRKQPAGQAAPNQPTPKVVHHTPAPPPAQTTHERHEATYANRLATAKQVDRSPLIQRFGQQARMQTEPAAVTASRTAPAHHATPSRHAAPQPVPELPNHVATQHEAMAQLAQKAPAPHPAAAHQTSRSKATWRPHLGLSPSKSRAATTAAAILILGSYIWLQNYPKLAIQTASNKASLTASLPGYLPSSYNLVRSEGQPGLVTLDFTSPGLTEVLKIAQHRTAWDSNSLLDNFVAKQADDYSTVHGQGLTIYIFGHNQAAWVNHGVWYSIEGASKLSREQLLKIAYSL